MFPQHQQPSKSSVPLISPSSGQAQGRAVDKGLTKQSIISKAIHVGGSTLISRIFGTVREALMSRYLGASGLSDAFFLAFKIPNSARKMFAEGAVSAAFVPVYLQVSRTHGQKHADSLMSLSFIAFESMVVVFCGLVMWYAPSVVATLAPGFDAVQLAQAVPYVRIMMPFIFFISTSALFAGALQSVNHFLIPALVPIILNVAMISALIFSLLFKLPVSTVCWAVVAGGALQCIAHAITYARYSLSFGSINAQTVHYFGSMLVRFLLCLISVSTAEINDIIDAQFASRLPAGSLSLLYYAGRYVAIPLGVFAIAFSTILLPHFSRVVVHARARMGFYILESVKLITWVIVPVAILLAVLGHKLFITIAVSDKFTLVHAYKAQQILCAAVPGLLFLSLNKIFLNTYYALGNTWIPGITTTCAVIFNIVCNYLLVEKFQAVGLAIATTISASVQTILLIVLLQTYFGVRIYFGRFFQFVLRICLQYAVGFTGFSVLYTGCAFLLSCLPEWYIWLLENTLCYWLWAGPLCALLALYLFASRTWFGIKLHFID
ncbi:murein biosynthesis integral membrane protein MurJ [Vermiphilus pyriformis]|nr:MAG: murein biosynthesis integral membrane protein MurJ [Vermiphilus pyriformis]